MSFIFRVYYAMLVSLVRPLPPVTAPAVEAVSPGVLKLVSFARQARKAAITDGHAPVLTMTLVDAKFRAVEGLRGEAVLIEANEGSISFSAALS